MTLRTFRILALVLAPCLALPALARPASAQDGGGPSCGPGGCGGGPSCGGHGCCGPAHHCPVTVFCRPKRPCICYKCTCPKPICDVCSLQAAGYYPVCWRPWLYPPDYSHCPVPPPTVKVPPCCRPDGVAAAPEDTLPLPRRDDAAPNARP